MLQQNRALNCVAFPDTPTLGRRAGGGGGGATASLPHPQQSLLQKDPGPSAGWSRVLPALHAGRRFCDNLSLLPCSKGTPLVLFL